MIPPPPAGERAGVRGRRLSKTNLANEQWTPLKLLAWTQGFFARAGVDAPRLTAELLLAHALGCDRVRLYLDFDKPLGAPELARYRELVRRRGEGEPTAYLTGAKEFYGRPFSVDARALIPRPETELLVEAALAALPTDGLALDLCTGSGCVAASLALERPQARVCAVDLSAEALALARDNGERLGAGVESLGGDLFAPLPPGLRFDVITANPPYVPSGELPGLAREVAREPRLALDGGPDGLALTRRVVAEAAAWLKPGGTLAVEMHESHAGPLPDLCRAAGFATAEVRHDLARLPRLVIARATGYELAGHGQDHLEGGVALRGEVQVSGAKNAALPILAATLLAEGEHAVANVPDLADVRTMGRLLASMGCEVSEPPPPRREGGVRVGTSTVLLHVPARVRPEATYDLVKTMRASVLVLGPLLARFGEARVSLPGGCAIGARPIDQHLKALTALGAEIAIEHGYVEARVPRGRLGGASSSSTCRPSPAPRT